MAIEMEGFDSFLDAVSPALPLDTVHVVCVEEKLSLSQRYKLRKLVESEASQKRVQDFYTFIKKFPECNANPEDVYNEVIGKITD